MWSMGIVTLSLFTGDTHIRFKELHDLRQSIITTRITNALQHPWVQISTCARDFVERLLVLNPEERMLAHEAVEHDWFQRPGSPGVAAKLDELLGRANEYWWKRTSSINLIENLPDVTIIGDRRPDTYNGPRVDRCKTRKKIPDATASPYFGLDRHLQRPDAMSVSILNTKRRKLLADLIETDSQFLDACGQVREERMTTERVRGTPIKPQSANMELRQKPYETQIVTEGLALKTLASKLGSQTPATAESIKEVDAADLFGTTLVQTRHAQVTRDHLSHSNPLQPRSALGSSNDIAMEAQDVNTQSASSTEHGDQTLEKSRAIAYHHIPSQVSDIDYHNPKYAMLHRMENCGDSNSRLCIQRNYSESAEDRDLHEEASKALPKLTTAMAYSQAIAKERQATRTKRDERA
jgi:serine/threonine protein kinase